MAKITIRAVPKFYLSLTLAQVKLITELSSSHYDGVCRSASAVGGFIYGWVNLLTYNPSEQVSAEWRQLDTVLKICEMASYLDQAQQDEVAKLRKSIYGALNKAAELFQNWSADYDD